MRIRSEFAAAVGPSHAREAQEKAVNFSAPLDAAPAAQLFDTVSQVGQTDLRDRQALSELDELRRQGQLFSNAGQARVDQVQDEVQSRWHELAGSLPAAALPGAERLARAAQGAAGCGVLFGAATAMHDGIFSVDLHRQTSNEYRGCDSLTQLAGDQFHGDRDPKCSLMAPERMGVLMVDTVDGVAFLAR